MSAIQLPSREDDLQQKTNANDDISLFAIGSVLLRQRWRIARWTLAGAIIPALIASFLPRTWTSSASFVAQGTDAGQSGLRSLAGQFGVAIPGGATSGSQSPDFYAELISARVILGPIVDDSVPLPEAGGANRSVLDLLRVAGADSADRRERGVDALRKKILIAVSKPTGIIKFTIQMSSASAARAIADRILKSLNQFNLQSRQSQAAEERRFVESRLSLQRLNLLGAEGRLGAFVQSNRQFQNSPSLTFEFDRLQRDVSLQQQVLVGLAQSFEEARIREVRDVPVLTIIEAPALPARPDSRGRGMLALLGAVVGALLGIISTLALDMYARRRAEGDADAARFAAVAGEVNSNLRRMVGFRHNPANGGE